MIDICSMGKKKLHNLYTPILTGYVQSIKTIIANMIDICSMGKKKVRHGLKGILQIPVVLLAVSVWNREIR